MGGWELVIGCVGKPSAGKSTFFNAATNGSAKMGAYPFTTIEPNIGVTHFPVECPCAKVGQQEKCKPTHGWCNNGTRFVPVKLLDVAGLVPGACEGKGLGNKFLDDLCGAQVLIHVIDVSGTTNEKGEATTGYDPVDDADWLRSEIHQWIFNNIWTKWSSVVRKHVACKATVCESLQGLLSGYRCTPALTGSVLDRVGIKIPLENWEQEQIHEVVDGFMDVRFPTVLVLNKADAPESTKNIARLCRKFGDDNVIVSSALADCYLRSLAKKGFVQYEFGDDDVKTKDDLPDTPQRLRLKPMDATVGKRLENIRDMVIHRFGGTGIHRAIEVAVSRCAPVVAFPVPNLSTFGATHDGGHVFETHIVLKAGTSARKMARLLGYDLSGGGSVEGMDGRKLGEEEAIVKDNVVVKVTGKRLPEPTDGKGKSKSKGVPSSVGGAGAGGTS